MATLNIRLPQAEADLVTRYAAQTGRSKSEILREFIRSLEKKADEGALGVRVRVRAMRSAQRLGPFYWRRPGLALLDQGPNLV